MLDFIEVLHYNNVLENSNGGCRKAFDMTRIDIFSGFLGAGKTTLIKKLIKEAYKGEKVVLIENEFGEIGIDGGFLSDAGVEITEMNSGCICCSLVGDFAEALKKVVADYAPDRVVIEPSGVGKLSDVIGAVKRADLNGAELGCFVAVADVNKCKMYMKNFGEFYNDQIKSASAVILSHTDVAADRKVDEAVALLREHNPDAVIVTTPWAQLDGKDILRALERKDTLEDFTEGVEEEHHHNHGHHHHDHDEDCDCGCHGHHHHDHDEDCDCGCHGHHHHDHDEDCDCGCHEHHHHDHDEDCDCGCHGHHHHHHADEVFTSFGAETTKKFTPERITEILETFAEDDSYGMILRAKGIVAAEDGRWIHFDYVPDEPNVRFGQAGVIGRLCVIGAKMDKEKIKELFGV